MLLRPKPRAGENVRDKTLDAEITVLFASRTADYSLGGKLPKKT